MVLGGPLFGANNARSASKGLVEFRAGKMNLDTSTKMVTADTRKGLVSVYQDDQLMHFTWKDRGTGTIEEDLTIFPDDCEFVHVPACKTGRVYVLKFKTCSKRMFFWMQEPKSDKDEELCKKVNDTLNRAGGSSALQPGVDLNNIGDADLQNLLNNMSQSQLMQLFQSGGSGGGGAGAIASLLAGGGGGAGLGGSSGLASLLSSGGSGSSSGRSRQAAGSSGRPRPNIPASPANKPATAPLGVAGSTPAPAATGGSAAAGGSAATPASGSSAIQLSDLQSILSNIKVPQGAEGGDSSVDLATGLTTDVLQPLLSNPDFLNKVKEFLPKDEKKEVKDLTAEDLKDTVTSPQFKQAVTMFSMAFNSGQLGPLIREFGMPEAAIQAADKGDMRAFVQALQPEKKSDETPKKSDEPEDMALD